MTKALHDLIGKILCAVMAFSGIPPALGAEDDANLCIEAGTVFAFFNGVRTTKASAEVSLQEFRRLHGDTTTAGDRIKYEVLYNYSDGFEDFVETFEQRLLEQDGLLQGRFELFFEGLSGDGPWWQQIIDAVGDAAGILKGAVDDIQALIVRDLTSLLADPPTQVNYTEHRSRIDNWILEGKKLLYVAHSQGNLFANAAYDYTRQQVSADSVKLVHIAPASPTLNGNHTLADLDLVINALRLAGSVASITDMIPGYLLRPPGVTGEADVLGHGLLEIYINQQLAISTRVKGHITIALDSLVAPPVQASSGFFTATLTWDGSGDVDLHTFEPGGSHVYYRARTGSSGYLDVDNTVANGPEHYYASCQASRLQTGTYRIAVANYARAEGRTATVQIASWNEGALGTRSILLGAATGDFPAYNYFDVIVSKNEETGQYAVSLGP